MENDALSQNIQKLLNDPEGISKIQSMAASLFGEQPSEQPPVQSGEAETLIKAFNMLKNDSGDERGKLLLALKPHLREERRARVDKAVKLMRLMQIAPLLSDMDIFNL